LRRRDAKCLYGRLDEQQELRAIHRRFRRASIVNPAEHDRDPHAWAYPVGFYLKVIDKCDVVVFSRCLGKITTGVGKEVNHALKTGKKVFEFKAGKLVPRTRRVKYISRRSTKLLGTMYRRLAAVEEARLIAQRWKTSRGQRSALIPVIRFPWNQGQ
jgi:hypothetical protein